MPNATSGPNPTHLRLRSPRWWPFWLLALAALLAGCGRNESRADAYEALADQMFANKAYPAAITALDSAVKLDSNEPRRWVKLGRSWRALGNPALTAMSYQRALDLDPANIEALQTLAVLTVRAGRFVDAKQYVDPLLVLSPDDIGGLLAKGAIAFYERRYADADTIADQIIQTAPSISDGYVLRARVMEARGDPRQAAALLSQRLDLDAQNSDLAIQLLSLYQRMGDLGGIRRMGLLLSKLLPDDVSYQMEAARAYHAMGREDEARAILANLLVKHPNAAGLNEAVARYWLSTLPRDDAATRITGMAQKVGGKARARLADILVEMGRADAAVTLLAPLAGEAINNVNQDAQASYAAALFAAGKYAEADRQSLKVMQYDQNDVAQLVRARLAYRKRAYDEALIAAQAVRDNDPDNQDAALLVADIYEAKGDLLLSRQAYGDAQSKMPDNMDVVKAYVAWLLRHGEPGGAAEVAAQFARSHAKMGMARDYARAVCQQVKTRNCLLAQNNKRNPWNL